MNTKTGVSIKTDRKSTDHEYRLPPDYMTREEHDADVNNAAEEIKKQIPEGFSGSWEDLSDKPFYETEESWFSLLTLDPNVSVADQDFAGWTKRMTNMSEYTYTTTLENLGQAWLAENLGALVGANVKFFINGEYELVPITTSNVAADSVTVSRAGSKLTVTSEGNISVTVYAAMYNSNIPMYYPAEVVFIDIKTLDPKYLPEHTHTAADLPSGDNKIEVVVDIGSKTVTSGDISLTDLLALIQDKGWNVANIRLEENGEPMSFYATGSYLPYWFVLKYIAFTVATTSNGSQVGRLSEMWAKVKSDGTVTISEEIRLEGVAL